MNTKTLIWVAVGVAVAILGGAAILAATGDDGPTRTAALGAGAGPTTYQLTFPPEQPFAVSSYAVGATRLTGSATTKTAGAAQFRPLVFTKPLDEISAFLFEEGARGKAPPKVTLEVLSGAEKPAPVMTYDLTGALLTDSDESAAGEKRATQSVEVDYSGMAITMGSALGYAGAINTIGRLMIPGVSDASKPANLLSYSWGWSNPVDVAGTTHQGAFTLKSLTVERQLDSHAQWFWNQLVTAKPIPSIDLELEVPDSSGARPAPYATYRLFNVIVMAVHDSGETELREQITFEFTKIEARYGTRLPVKYDAAAATA